jgi:hypothetical protein
MKRSLATAMVLFFVYPIMASPPAVSKKCCDAMASFLIDSLQLPDKSLFYLYAYNGNYSVGEDGFYGLYGFCARNKKPDNSCSYIGEGESDSIEVKLSKTELTYRLVRWDPRDLQEHPLFEKHYSLDLSKCRTVILAKPIKFDEKLINHLFAEIAVPKENYEVGKYMFESLENTLELLLYIGISEPRKTIAIIDSVLSKQPQWNKGIGAKKIEAIKFRLEQMADKSP